MRFADAIAFTSHPQAPRLAVEDVVLRPHQLSDFDMFWTFYETSERAGFLGAPKTPTRLWNGLCSEIASWELRGFGGWAVEYNDALAGQVCISQPPHFPEIELGWILFDGFEGRGIASQAARLALDWFWSETDHDTLVSFVHPENTRSRDLAIRLGAVRDVDAERPIGETADETHVYRHVRPA